MKVDRLFSPGEIPQAKALLASWLGLDPKGAEVPSGDSGADLEALLVLAALLRPRRLPLPEDRERSVGARLLALLLPFWTKEAIPEALEGRGGAPYPASRDFPCSVWA